MLNYSFKIRYMKNITQKNLKFLRIALHLLLVLFFNNDVAFANGGIGYKGIKVNLNGTNSWYNIHGVSWGYQGCGDYGSSFYNSGNSNWAGADLGTFSTSATLQITGFAVIGWTDNSDWVSGRLNYKVWKQGDSEPGSWTTIDVGNYGNCSGAANIVCTSGNDRVIGFNDGATSFNPGVAGTYNFKVQGLGKMKYNCGEFNVNDGTILTATFTISAAVPTITSTSSSVSNNSTQTYRGATITINGTNLGSINAVKIGGSGGTSLTSVSASSSQVTAVVPDGSSGGTIWISDGTNNATSSDSYTNLGFITTNSGGWNTGGTWLGGSVPASGTSTNVTIAHNVTSTSGDVNVGRLTVNSSNTLTISSSTSIIVNTASTNSGTIASNGTFVVSGVTYTNSGTITIAGTFQLNQGAFVSGTNLSYSSGTLVFNHSSGQYGVANNHAYWPSSSGPTNVIVNGNGSTGIQLQTGASRTINGTLTLNNTFDIQSLGLLTVNGIVQINSGGNFSSNTPIYGNTSSLIYNTGGSYGISNEWTGNSTTAGSGVPNNVTIQNSTTLTFPTTNRGCSGNFNIISGGATLNATSGDLYVAGNFTNSGTFTHSNRAVFLNGIGAQTLNGTLNGTTTTNCFPYLLINNGGGVTLNTPVNVTNTLTLTTGIITTTSTNILHITNTAAAAMSGGNSTSYINGPLRWSVSNSGGGDYKFHLGKSSTYLPLNVNNPTGTSPVITAEAFAANTGGSAGSGLSSLSTSEYWSVVNTGTLSASTISLAKTSLGGSDGIGSSTTLAGSYTNLGGSTTNTLISGNTVTAGSTVGSLATTTYFVLATKVAAPTISSFTPSSGYVGTSITITGTNFTGATAVSIGAVAAASYTVNSSTQITATVAAGASTGTISVTTPGGTATSGSSFTFNGYISTQNGDWNTAATWLGGSVPLASSTVTIDHAVTVNSSVANAPSSVTINSTKSLTFGASGALTATTVTNNGSIVMTSGGTLTISSGGTLANGTSTFTGGSATVAFAGTGTVTGTIGFNNVTLAGGVNFGSASTINGTMSINSGGFVNTNPPTYASGSTLRYNSGGSYGRDTEWSATSGAGYPHHVQISNSTTFSLGANSGTGTARQLAGNLTVDASSTLTMNATSEVMTQALTVKGNYINNGTTILSGSSGGDLALEGDLTDNATFTANGRAIFFRGSNTQSITSNTNPLDIDVMRVEKSGGEIVLLQNLLVDETGDPIQFSGASSILNLNGYTATFGTAGTTSTITMNSTSAIKGSSTSSLSILGNGAFGSIRFDQTTPGTTNLLQNFTIDRGSSGSVSLSNNLSVGGTLALTNGTLIVGGNTLTYSGSSITRTSGNIDASNASATLAFTNTAALTLPASLFSGNVNNLTINGAGGVTLGSATTISGVLTLTSGSLVVGANTLTINGSLNRTAGSIDATNNSANVVFAGSGNTEVPISALGSNLTNLTVNKSGIVQLGGDVTVNGILTMTLGDLDIGSGNLTLGSSASVSNAGASSHILATSTGELRKIYGGSGSFTFPVGDGTNYTPATVNFTTAGSFNGETTDYLGVRLKTSKVTNMNANNTNYINRSWFIEPHNSASGYTYTVDINYVDGDVVGTEGEIRPVKLSSGVWQYPGNVSFADGTQLSGTSGSINTTTNVLTWSGLTSFSEFGGGGQGGPLPVELTSFATSCEEDVVTLSWSTASEQNSSHFDIEKSIDGETWRIIGTVIAAGNSTQDIDYTFVDDEKSNGKNYYRLNQVDIDGKNEYFGPIQTNCVEKIQFTTFPNPSSASFQVILTNKELVGMCSLVISDATGKVIEQRTIDVKEGINLFVINQEFTPGIYFLNVTNDTKSTPILRHAVK